MPMSLLGVAAGTLSGTVVGLAPSPAHATTPLTTCAALSLTATGPSQTVASDVTLGVGDKVLYTLTGSGFSNPATAFYTPPGGTEMSDNLGTIGPASAMFTATAAGLYNVRAQNVEGGSTTVTVTCTPGPVTTPDGGTTSGPGTDPSAVGGGLLNTTGGDVHAGSHSGSGGNGGNGGTSFADPLSINSLAAGIGFDVDVLGLLTAADGLMPGTALGVAEGESGVNDVFRLTVSGDYTNFDDDKSTADRNGDVWRADVIGSIAIGRFVRIGGFASYEEGGVEREAVRSSTYPGKPIFSVSSPISRATTISQSTARRASSIRTVWKPMAS
jgi:hypothetical protein